MALLLFIYQPHLFDV